MLLHHFEKLVTVYNRAKKVVLFSEIDGVKIFFHHLPARITECVSEYIFFVSNKKTHTQTKSKIRRKTPAPESLF